MIERFTKKRNAIFKRITTVILSLMVAVTVVIPCIPATPVFATGAEFIGIGVAEAVSSGAMSAGMVSGGLTLGSVVGIAGLALDFYNTITNSGKHGDIYTNYIQGGDTYNTTVNYKVFNDYTKNIDVSQEYNYSFYNPVTNNYNFTNDYSYNPSYNTYYYTTNEGDTNTEYYITDNTTNVSYYIIQTNETTLEKFESYYEIYFELPDGRNSYNLKKEDIWGQYFIYDYSKYESVAEDDGTTLGLWHLDGNLKDSSYWNNSAGASYSSNYRDARFEGGKYLSTSETDYFTLPLDKVSLPSSWTLEWVQYVPYVEDKKTISELTERKEYLNREEVTRSPSFVAGVPGYTVGTGLVGEKIRYYNVYKYNEHTLSSGACGITDIDYYFSSRTNTLEHYAIVKEGNVYSYYINGVKQTPRNDGIVVGGGITIDNSGIKFSVGTKYGNYTSYKLTKTGYRSIEKVGVDPTSSNFTDDNYRVYSMSDIYVRELYRVKYNSDTIVDEVRLSKGAIYTGNFVSPTQPFTTNTVLVAPKNPSENEIGFMTNYALGNVRIGGARPTYPSSGDVFVNLTNDKVDSVQQYQENGWYEITGTIYENGKWTDLKGYDMSVHTVTRPDPTDPVNPGPDNPGPDNPDPDNPDNPDPDNPEEGGSIWDKIGRLLSSLFGIVEKLIGPLIDGIISLINMIMEALGSLAGLSEGFSNFLKVTFAFIPDDILSIIGLGVMLTIFASIIKIFM